VDALKVLICVVLFFLDYFTAQILAFRLKIFNFGVVVPSVTV
jgi:hypothetical protein